MTTHKESLTLALEALEIEQAALAYEHGKVEHIENAIIAIKEALAQPEQEPVVWMYQNKSTHEVRFQKNMRDFVDHGAWYEVPLYSEPLANQEKTSGSPIKELNCICGAVWEGEELVHTPPQPKELEQDEYLSKAYRLANELRCHLAIAPAPQRTWVGLTDEEINKVLGGDIHDEPNGLLEFVRAIEAKLKEKNT